MTEARSETKEAKIETGGVNGRTHLNAATS